jgi:hypothetical protein
MVKTSEPPGGSVDVAWPSWRPFARYPFLLDAHEFHLAPPLNSNVLFQWLGPPLLVLLSILIDYFNSCARARSLGIVV